MKSLFASKPVLPRLLLLAVSSAVLMALALPNELFRFGQAPLGFLALVPLYAALLESSSYRSAAAITGLYGAIAHALSSYWLYNFKDFAFWTIGATTLAYAVVYSVLGLYLGLFLKKAGTARPAAFALIWAVFEYMKSNGFLGYPWGLIPYSLTGTLPLLQIADITGIYGLSAVLALCNAALAEIFFRVDRQAGPAKVLVLRVRAGYAGLAIVSVGVVAGYGFIRMADTIPQVGRLSVVIVQQNADPWSTDEGSVLAANVELTRKALKGASTHPDLILFSESTLRRPYREFYSYFSKEPQGDPLIPMIADSGAYLFTGAPVVLDWKTFEATNSVLLIAPDGRLVKSYAKMHPVPFAEAIPFWEYPGFRTFMQKVVGLDSGWVMGRDYTIFDLPTKSGLVRFGAPICFEDAFPKLCRQFFLRGADILVNLTDDSWSKTVSAEVQHLAAARFRSIEFRRTMVRSTNSGFSCVVGPHGEIETPLPLFEASSKLVDVPVCKEADPTLYSRLGDWFSGLALLLSAFWAIIMMTEDMRINFARRR